MKNNIGESIYCRVCLRTDAKVKKKCVSLFTKHNDSHIFEIINSIADVKIQQDDGLPSKICPDCLSELDVVVGFKSKCESSTILLKTTILSSQKVFDQESPPIKSSEEIKKEEPEEVEEYIEAAYLEDAPEYLEEISTKVENDVEPEPESDKNENSVVKKSRAIDLKLECNECGGFFKSKCKMRVHWKKVHMHESLICPLCKRTFKSLHAYKVHQKRKSKACITASKVNIVGLGKSRVFHCNKCDYFSKRVKSLESHMVIHTGERPFVCDICSRGFSQQSSLQGHMEAAHKIYRTESTCMYCGKYLKGRRQIYCHMKTHSTKFVQCDICKKFLKSKNTLVEHLKRHSGVKSYTCDQCAKTFYVLSELCNHKRNVHEKGKHIFTCDMCGYKAFKAATIKKHKSKHTGSNLPCIKCGMFFENTQTLKVHQKRHFGERNFPCPHCEKKYLNRKSLSQHVREIHKCTFLINKPIKCEAAEKLISMNQGCPDSAIKIEIFSRGYSKES